MSEGLQLTGLVVSMGGAIGAVIAAVVGMRNSRKIDDLDSKVDVLSGRADEHGRILQSLIGALLKTTP